MGRFIPDANDDTSKLSLSMHNVVAVSYVKNARENETIFPIEPDSSENAYYYSSNADAKAWPSVTDEADAAHRMTSSNVDDILAELNKDNENATWEKAAFCPALATDCADSMWPRVVIKEQKPQEGE